MKKNNFTLEQIKAMAATTGATEAVFGKSNERLLAEDTLKLYSEIYELKQDIKHFKDKNVGCDTTEETSKSQKIHIDALLNEINILRGERDHHMREFHTTTAHLENLQVINSQLTDKVRTFKKR